MVSRIFWNIWPLKAPPAAALQIAEAIGDVGGYINAYTSRGDRLLRAGA